MCDFVRVINYYNVNRDINIVPLGIKPLKKYDVSKESLGIEHNSFVFSTIGRLVRRKNIPDLLNVFKEISNEFNSYLLIMGDGPEKENIKIKIDELGIEKNVRLLGRVSDEEKLKYSLLNFNGALLLISSYIAIDSLKYLIEPSLK